MPSQNPQPLIGWPFRGSEAHVGALPILAPLTLRCQHRWPGVLSLNEVRAQPGAAGALLDPAPRPRSIPLLSTAHIPLLQHLACHSLFHGDVGPTLHSYSPTLPSQDPRLTVPSLSPRKCCDKREGCYDTRGSHLLGPQLLSISPRVRQYLAQAGARSGEISFQSLAVLLSLSLTQWRLLSALAGSTAGAGKGET